MSFLRRFSDNNVTTLTDATTIDVDMQFGPHFQVTLEGNRTLGNPTNLSAAKEVWVAVRQDAIGGRTLEFGTDWVAIDSTTTINSAANSVTVIYAVARDFGDGTKWYYVVEHANETSGTGSSSGLTPTAVQTSSYSASDGDFVLVDISAGDVHVELPAATAGAKIAVKIIGAANANKCTVTVASSGTIDDESSLILNLDYQYVEFFGTASGWSLTCRGSGRSASENAQESYNVTAQLSPMAHWIFDTDPATDTTGNGHNLTTVPTSTVRVLLDGGIKGMLFPTTTGSTYLTSASAFATTAFTSSILCFLPTFPTGYVDLFAVTANSQAYIIRCAIHANFGMQMAWETSYGSNYVNYNSMILPPISKPVMLTFSRDSANTQLRFYVNADLIATVAPTIPVPPYTSQRLYIGGNPYSASYPLVAYCASWWNSELTPAQVEELYLLRTRG